MSTQASRASSTEVVFPSVPTFCATRDQGGDAEHHVIFYFNVQTNFQLCVVGSTRSLSIGNKNAKFSLTVKNRTKYFFEFQFDQSGFISLSISNNTFQP